MSSSDPTSSIVRFGEFTVDLEAGELLRGGVKVKLQGQPFQILVTLLSRPGHIVSREELRRNLWASDTFVDFEHGLNAAINRLREALGDSSNEPRFIETLPRRGYRFIFPLTDSIARPTAEPVSVDCSAEKDGGTRSRLKYYLIGSLALATLLTALAFWLLRVHEPRVVGWKQLSFVGQGTAEPLLTDGKRIYFMIWKDGKRKLAYVSVTGGEPAIMPIPFAAARLSHISPDGSTLLISANLPEERSNSTLWREGHLWLVPTDGGGPRRIANIDGQNGAWSPDGRQIVMADGNDLYVANNDGSERRKIGTAPGKAYDLRWSPDTKRIRFTLLDPHKIGTTLWECKADGSGLHRVELNWGLTKEPEAECCSQWTPDGRYFMFGSDDQETWLIPEQGFGKHWYHPIQLTGPSRKIYSTPKLDGKGLFVLHGDDGSELYTYDLNTHHITRFLEGILADKAWTSPDHQWLAYTDFNRVLWRSRLDGTGKVQLSGPDMVADYFQWSPDSQLIAFQARVQGGDWNIYVVPAAGGVPKLLMPEQRNLTDPEWSPDAHSIMFGRAPLDYAQESTVNAISILNLDTHVISTLRGSEGLFCGRWSSNGRYVVGMTLDYRKLMLFDFDTQKWTELLTSTTNKPRTFDTPRWSADMKYVYVNDIVAGKFLRIERANGRLQEIFDFRRVVPHDIGCFPYAVTNDDQVFLYCLSAPRYISSVDMDWP